MATTFLQLTNELLREMNEVVLTSSTFSSAVGIQAHSKDCINRAYLDIVNEEPQWPFLATGESGATDPMYGNVAVSTTAGTRWYELKAASSALKDDYGSIDWDNFYFHDGFKGCMEWCTENGLELNDTSHPYSEGYEKYAEHLNDVFNGKLL